MWWRLSKLIGLVNLLRLFYPGICCLQRRPERLLILFIALVPLVMLALAERFKKYSIDVPIFYPGSVIFVGGIIAALAALYLLLHLVIMLVGK
jgi:hypothetical protein